VPVGGFAAVNDGDIHLSFYDYQMSEQSRGYAFAFGLTTRWLQTGDLFLAAGWDFTGETENGTDDIWWILEGQDYPRLWWEEQPTRLQSSW
jgi:hypothetical protein